MSTENKRLWIILDAKYKKAYSHKVMETQCLNLTKTQCNDLLKLLQKIEDLSDGTLGTRKTDLVDFELKEGAKPVCSRPYPVPKVHEESFKIEVECLVQIGVFRLLTDSEWGASSFIQSNSKSNRVNFLSDFRSLYRQFKQKNHPLPKINELLLKLECFNMLHHMI